MPVEHRAASKWSTADGLAMQALAPLLSGYVAWTEWSARPAALVTVVNEIAEQERVSVLELGSGTSTIVLGAALRHFGGTMVSVEHDPLWAAHIERELGRHGLSDTVRLEVVPLTAYHADRPAPPGWRLPERWYDEGRLASVAPEDIDLLLVDGPPAVATPDALVREPAAAALAPRLAADFTIALDDVDRDAELATVERWELLLGIEITVFKRLALAMGRSRPGFLPAF